MAIDESSSFALPQEMVKEGKTRLPNRGRYSEPVGFVPKRDNAINCQTMQRVAAFMRSANAKICFRPAKQAFATARMAIRGKCQGCQEILSEYIASVRRQRHYS